MAITAKDIYRSSNGDRWQLIRDTASGRSFVRHEPNLSSGGRTTDTEVEEFLNRTGSSPENLALRALLGKETPRTGASDSSPHVGDGTAGKAEAARKSADKTGAATASADRRATEADSDTACGEPAPSDRGRTRRLIKYHAPPLEIVPARR